MPHQIQFGIDNFLKQTTFKKQKIALVTNDAAFSSEKIRTRIALLQNNFSVVKLFSPEHGLTAKGEDGVFQKNGIDTLTGLPIISLYSEKLAPSERDLFDIDIVLFDLPDVGCRFYTYLWTMTHVMEACALFHKTFVLADRPNPISGNFSLAEGPMLREHFCSSFIGRWKIPIRHCCTLGELALYFSVEKIKDIKLEIISAGHWNREEMQTATRFTPTSPAIKNLETALLYPGMGLLEGININEGRGTEKPFGVCGAPWINANELFIALVKKSCMGLSFRTCSYRPIDGLYRNQTCYGLEFFVEDEKRFRPVATGISLLQTICDLYPQQVTERLYRTTANPDGTKHLDKLLGIENAFNRMQIGEKINTDVSHEWSSQMENFLLY